LKGFVSLTLEDKNICMPLSIGQVKLRSAEIASELSFV
jgi:hypothetical protein